MVVVVGGWLVVVCKPILVFSLSLGQAEQSFFSLPFHSDNQIHFRKDPCTNACKKRLNVRAHVYARCACVRAQIFTKIYSVVSNYLMNLSSKYRKDPCFR